MTNPKGELVKEGWPTMRWVILALLLVSYVMAGVSLMLAVLTKGKLFHVINTITFTVLIFTNTLSYAAERRKSR